MIRKNIFIYFILFLASYSFSADYSVWDKSCEIKLNTTSTGADVTSNSDKFPVLVRFGPTNFDFFRAAKE